MEQTDIEVTSTEAKGQWRHRNGLIECREVCTLPCRASAYREENDERFDYDGWIRDDNDL